MTTSGGARFVALVGFPRSGTTLLAALIDAHTDVRMYYEPWNSSPKHRPDPPETFAEFCEGMERRFGFGVGCGDAEEAVPSVEELQALHADLVQRLQLFRAF